jgi:hypothetical protein
MDVDELANLLIPWSRKQVRTKFDHLMNDGRIDRKRAAGNAAWFYCLPEAISRPQTPFAYLPDPALVRVAIFPVANAAGAAVDCPACPPLAHDRGQAETSIDPPVTAESE